MIGNKPIKRIESGFIVLAVWSNEVPGSVTQELNFTVARRFKNKKGGWSMTKNIRPMDMKHLKKTVDEAYKLLRNNSLA